MARIQIPLDVLTSRLNLGDRFAGVRSQSLAARFANLRPISEFLDIKRFSKPDTFGEVQSRVNYNLSHFSSNYAVVFVMLSIYSLLTNPTLIFLIVLVVGGMWGIGKLDGRDLDIGVIKATTSQLYTVLLIVAVPLFFIASPFSTILWLIGFFRGGGLGGRPRSPKRVPSWGRPPGAKANKQRKKWEQELWMEEQDRIQELDSEDGDAQDDGLDIGGKRFPSDSLQFTGLELLPKASSRRRHAYDRTDSDSQESRSGSEDDGYESEVSQKQIALRDKEEALVQSALARIRRAHQKGKREVELNPEELEALERRRKRMQSAAIAPKSRKGGAGSGGSGSERKIRADRAMITVPIAQLQPRRHSDKYRGQSPPRPSSGPAMMVDGPDGIMYAPIGHYPMKRDSPTRPRSSASLGHQSRHTPDPYASEYAGRHISDENRPTSTESARVPLPHQESWTPDSRRSSISSRYAYDPFEYQTSAGDPAALSMQYMQGQGGRRNVSGPPQVSYSAIRRSPPMGTNPTSSRKRISDPIIDRGTREEGFPESDGDRSYSDDESDGPYRGGVSVEPERPVIAASKKPVGGNGGRRKGRR